MVIRQQKFRTPGKAGLPTPPPNPGPIKVVTRQTILRDKAFHTIFGAIRHIAETPADRRRTPRNEVEQKMHDAAVLVAELVAGVK